MLKHADEMQETPRPDIRHLFERLSAETRDWAEAEIVLARAELNALKRQAIRAAIFAALAFAAVFCALWAFSLAGIVFLAPHVDGPGVAALLVGCVLLVILALSVLAVRNAISWHTESVFFRWLGRRPPGGARP